MSPPLRIEFDEIVYHFNSRGDRKTDISDDEEERLILLEVPGDELAKGQDLAP